MKALRTLILLLASVFVLTACQSPSSDSASSSSTGSTTSASSAVTFIHPTIPDLRIEFDKKPEVIVTDYYTAAAMSVYGIKPAAVFGYGKDDAFIKDNVNLEGVPTVGQDGEINLEKLAEIKPDVIIGHGNKNGWTWFKEDVNTKMTKVAPFIPLSYKASDVDDNIKQTRDVAEFLGGDVTSAEVKKADEKWEAAKQDLAKAAEGKDLSIILLSPLKETVYTAVGFAQSKLFEDAGITVLGAERPKEGNPWGKLAWEELSTYPADIYAYEQNSGFTDLESTFWKDSKPVQANQIFEWNSKLPYNTKAYSEWLAEVASKVAEYKKLS